jgi:hypothetical protein
MVSPVLQCLAGGALVLVGMLVALGLARLAANLFIALVACAAVAGAVFAILNGYWVGWSGLVSRSLLLGVVAALLCLPALPFSSFHGGKRK